MTESNFIVNNFQDLLALGSKIKCIPLQRIISLSLDGLQCSASGIARYEFLFTKVVLHVDGVEYETQISTRVVPELLKYTDQVCAEFKANTLPSVFTASLSAILSLAVALQKLIECLVGIVGCHHQYKMLLVFPEFLTRCYKVVRRNYAPSTADGKALELMKRLFTVCQKIQSAFLVLLCGNANVTGERDSREENSSLKRIMFLLADIGEEIRFIEPKLTTDVWKGVVKFCTQNSDQLIWASEAFGDRWICDLNMRLTADIDKAFRAILLSKELSKETIVSLKLNAFLLRVLTKLLPLSDGHNRGSLNAILKATIHLQSILRDDKFPTELKSAIEQHMLAGYMSIVDSSLQSAAFAEALSHQQCETPEEIHSFYCLMVHVIKHLIRQVKNDSLLHLYCDRFNLLAKCTELLAKSHIVFNRNDHIYQDLLTHMAAFVLICTKRAPRARQTLIEELLVRMVVQSNYWVGMFGVDLWCVIVRYYTSQLLYRYFGFWKTVNDQYSLFVTLPEQVFVRCLLRNLYTFLPSPYKRKIDATMPIANEQYVRLWAVIGVANQETAMPHETLHIRLMETAQRLRKSEITVRAMYELLQQLTLLSSCQTNKQEQQSFGSILKTLDLQSLERNQENGTIAPGFIETVWGAVVRGIPARHLHSFLESFIPLASPYCKLQTLYLFDRSDLTQLPSEVHRRLLDTLVNDPHIVIKMQTALYLVKLQRADNSMAKELASRHMQMLANFNSHTTAPVETLELEPQQHVCHSHAETEDQFSLTLEINNKIDELFPDDDEFLISSTRSSPKKRRLDPKDDITLERIVEQLETSMRQLKETLESRKLTDQHLSRLTNVAVLLSELTRS